MILWVFLLKAGICLADPATLLILPFENATDRTDLNYLRNKIPDLLTVSLTQHAKKIQVVERDKLDFIMAEQSLKLENVVTRKTFQMGQLAQAHYILSGSFSRQHENITLVAMLYETETTRLLHSFATDANDKSLETVCDELAKNIVSQISTEPGRFDPAGRTSLDPDPETSLGMTRGLAFYYQNQFGKAIPEFMKVLGKQPNNADAKYYLVKSYGGAGLKDHAVLEAQEFLKCFPKDPRSPEMQEIVPQ
jgi:TolB-like protein